MTPDFSAFKRICKKGNLVAVVKTIPADLETPVSCFLKLAGHARKAFLLESAEQEEKIGRYSIIGLEPQEILQSRGGRITAAARGKKTLRESGRKFIDILEEKMAGFKIANPEAVPGFSGGLVGYLAYESVEDFENIRLEKRPGLGVPEGIFFLSQDFVLFDHFRKSLSIVAMVDTRSRGSLASLYRQAEQKIERSLHRLKKPLALPKTKIMKRGAALKSNMTRQAFASKVNRIKEYIRAGDCIQVVLSQRFSLPLTGDDFQIYRALRSINPSPYMFYFRCDAFRMVGTSPEVLVKKTGRTAEVRPIAGTRPRGRTPFEDAALAESLRRSPKETAEHLMLVDLGRNDLGRVCQFDSIRVADYARIERYSHVMHLVSDVLGRLKSGKSAFDLIKAAFPAGTVSGAPKIRAMQIINELEPERRGPYAGCLGYFGFNHDMDMCITIRTLVIDGKKIYAQAGAGIVKDSNPGREYQETVNKAKALLKALARQGEF